MVKKRDKMSRRRQVSKTRGGTQKPAVKSTPPPVAAKKEVQSGTSDLWLAVGIVVAILAAFGALYYFGVKNPPQKKETAEVVATTDAPAQGEVVRSWSEPPAMQIDTAKSYQAVLKTDKGDIRIQLYADKVPMTVNNFVFLARQGFYDGVTFHRVIAGFMAQTGDPTGTGSGGPGYTFTDEFGDSLKHDGPGVLSMANRGPNTNGSQFFITYAPQPHLDGLHAVFGRVVEGMDVLEALTPRNPSDANAPLGDKILTVEIVES
jgi:cyclophilin family peptidyl-prolyl cis-trans isomerase